MSVALSHGPVHLATCFIPPTPGPIAAAGTLGCGDNLLLVMGLGALCSIPPLVAGYFFAKYIGKKVKAADDISQRTATSRPMSELDGRVRQAAERLASHLRRSSSPSS